MSSYFISSPDDEILKGIAVFEKWNEASFSS
jgi:hypothetical protein